MKLIFGLYRVHYDDVPSRIEMAQGLGITHFDTAQMYRNESVCAQSCSNINDNNISDNNDISNSNTTITTKMYDVRTRNDVASLLKKSIKRFTPLPINNMLFHRPVQLDCWQELTNHRHKVGRIGVSNYSLESLSRLLVYCQEYDIPSPQVHQFEIHPFVDCIPLIKLCQEKNIIIQGHTVLAQGKFKDYIPLTKLAAKHDVSWATILMSWISSFNIDICISSSSAVHLEELITATKFVLPMEDIMEINNWHYTSPHRFYKYKHEVYTLDPKKLADQLLAVGPDGVTELCVKVPISDILYKTFGQEIADHMYPDIEKENSRLNLYRNYIKAMRSRLIKKQHEDISHEKLRKKGLSCCVRRRTTGPYSEHMTNPIPMPVDITSPDEFIPFFDYLRHSDQLPLDKAIFPRGTMFPDGRMDMCKQVVGPTSIKQLCEVACESRIVQHFLLGNNIAFQDNEKEGAEAMASVMSDTHSKIKTWYLAGNCIGPVGISIIARALQHNTIAEALWLKRNPIGPLGATSINTLLQINRALVVLDLHNCALLDSGLVNLFSQAENITALKHLYLDANCIEHVEPMLPWCQDGKATSISLSINRLGDEQIIKLLDALEGNTYLKRLNLASCHLGNDSIARLRYFIPTCVKLRSLHIGSYKSTSDMGEHPGNFFDNDSVTHLSEIITETKLQYFNVILSRVDRDLADKLPINQRMTTVTGSKFSTHTTHDNKTLQKLRHGKRVVNIDSIYRGKM